MCVSPLLAIATDWIEFYLVVKRLMKQKEDSWVQSTQGRLKTIFLCITLMVLFTVQGMVVVTLWLPESGTKAAIVKDIISASIFFIIAGYFLLLFFLYIFLYITLIRIMRKAVSLSSEMS